MAKWRRMLPKRFNKLVAIRLLVIIILAFMLSQLVVTSKSYIAHYSNARSNLDHTLNTDESPATTNSLYVFNLKEKVEQSMEMSPQLPAKVSLQHINHPLHYGLEAPIDKQGALLAGYPRKTKGHLTIGIPTVQREKGTYLVETMTSLISNMNQQEREQTTIVIFLADLDETAKKFGLREIKREFQGYIDMGLILVVSAPASFYPSLDGLKRTYGHGENQVKWRSKQNYDYAFMFKYSTEISEYYMQLEDDVVTIKDYIQIIKDFIAEQKNDWVCLELSELGYIGKVYHSKDLEQLAKMMMLFFQEQPPDVTFIYFNILLLQFQRIIRIPTIFQHMGYHSSLTGKIQPLKDTHFDDVSKQLNGDNPPASIYTNFTTYVPYNPHFAYSKTYGYFWAKYPAVSNYYLLVFDRPERIKRIIIKTGSTSHPDDILRDGIVEISPTLVSKTKEKAECANYFYAGNFTSGQIDIKNVTDYMMHFDVFCIRITMTQPQEPWIIFREIAIYIHPK